MRLIIVMVLAGLMSTILSGCGANYVASNKDLGIQGGNKPVVGVMVTSFVMNNNPGNPLGALIGARFNDEVTQSLKEDGLDAKTIRFSETQTHPQLAAAFRKYDTNKDYRKKVSDGYDFGDMRNDFKDLGIDLLVIISGDAFTPNVPLWAQGAAFAATGRIGISTPVTSVITTSINRNGKPIYNDLANYTSMGRRDFGDDSSRKSIASSTASGIKGNSF